MVLFNAVFLLVTKLTENVTAGFFEESLPLVRDVTSMDSPASTWTCPIAAFLTGFMIG